MLKGICSLKNRILTDKIKLTGLLLIPVILICIQPEWLSAENSVCIYKNITGHECYGCGMTRAIVSAIHFRFSEAWQFNRLVVLVLPLLFWIWIRKVISLFDPVWLKPEKRTSKNNKSK
jgi:hypothetical protein